MQIYLKDKKYYEDASCNSSLDKSMTDRMIESGADIFIIESSGKIIQVSNKYKYLIMLDCLNYFTKRIKKTMESSDVVPRQLCQEAFNQLETLLKELPEGDFFGNHDIKDK